MTKLLPAPMRASKTLAFQLTVISLLFAVLTVKLSVDHPEWSPNGLTEIRMALPHQMDSQIRLVATP
ncbi:MAG: hypothetical protein WA776_22415 [Xanthobacteraceae bacterium]